jgi:glucose/arabinose dehydrogenase
LKPRWRRLAPLLLLAGLAALPVATAEAHGGPLPSGFRDSIAIADLGEPTAVRIAADGRVFIARKNGEIVVYEDFDDSQPALFADLRAEVYDHGDRGLLGLALDPDFEGERPYVYALYTFDHVLGEGAPGSYPRWGQPPEYEGDPCPKPEAADVDACPVSGRLVRLTAAGEEAVAEVPLVEGWCQQFSSHSVGDLHFGPEGALYASGGEGASFTVSDYGQFGWPSPNQCGDPPGGGALAPPTAEGGSLRALDLLTPADPTGLSGSVIRVDPDTGEGLPDNPLAASPDANARRIVAFGFRNPFRFAVDPQAGELFVANVGNGTYEEIDRFPLVPPAPYDSGWPCLEGPGRNPGFEVLELDLCKGLYEKSGSTAEPFFYYRHGTQVTPDDHCPAENGSALTGMAVYRGASFPSRFDGALFFADAVRGCIYVMLADENGELDPLTTQPFLSEDVPYTGADMQVGPDGDLYFLSLYGDESLHRISYDPGAPTARLEADRLWGAELPLEVDLDATGSTDPEGETLAYAWDLDGNGSYETPGGEKRTVALAQAENRTIGVRVTDPAGKVGSDRVTVYPGDRPPRIVIEEPLESLTWGVGEEIDFYGKAWPDAGAGIQLEAKRLYWRTTLAHCPGGPGACHEHPLRMFPGTETGTLVAPDHDFPSYIRVALTATDARGLSATKTVQLQPRAVALGIRSDPPGIALSAGNSTNPAPFSLTAIEGANITLAAPATAEVGGRTHTFVGWSDGGERVHSLVAHGAADYVATYSGPPAAPADVPGSADAAPPAGTPDAVAAEPPPLAVTPSFSRRPPRRAAGRSARFEFSAAAAVGFRCRLDESAFEPCRSPLFYRRLSRGWHVLRVVAVGSDGSLSEPLTFRWRVVVPRDAARPQRPTRPAAACARSAAAGCRRGR